MKNLIFLIILSGVGCYQRYDTSLQNENNLLKSLVVVNNNQTFITNRTNTTTTVTNSGSGTVSVSETTVTTVTGTGGSAPSPAPAPAPVITARNYYVQLSNSNNRFFKYADAERVCSDRGMVIVSEAELVKFAEIMVTTARNYMYSTTTARNLWDTVNKGYYRFWIRDVDSGLADDSVSYFYNTNPYDSYSSGVYLRGKQIMNNTIEWNSALCFK